MSDLKPLFIQLTHKLTYCLLIADLNKLALMLFLYLKMKLFETEKSNKTWLKYNEDKICRECYRKNKGLSAMRGRKELEDKNIITYDKEQRRIKLNCDPITWNVTPEQHEEIVKVLNSDNFMYKEISK